MRLFFDALRVFVLRRAFLEFCLEFRLGFFLLAPAALERISPVVALVVALLPAGALVVALDSSAAGGAFLELLRAELGGSEALRGLEVVVDRFDKERVRAIGVRARLILAGGVHGVVLRGEGLGRAGRAARPWGVATLRKPSSRPFDFP